MTLHTSQERHAGSAEDACIVATIIHRAGDSERVRIGMRRSNRTCEHHGGDRSGGKVKSAVVGILFHLRLVARNFGQVQ